MNIKKIVSAILVVILIIGGLSCFSFQNEIEKNLECAVINEDGIATGEKRTVFIQGKYKNYLMQQDKFEGTIKIEGINEECSDEEKETMILKISDKHSALITETGIHKGTPVVRNIGEIWSGTQFKYFVIFLFSSDGSKNEYLCYPNAEVFEIIKR